MREKNEKRTKNDLRYIKQKTNSKTFRDMILEMDYTQITQRTNRTSTKINRKHFICIILH